MTRKKKHPSRENHEHTPLFRHERTENDEILRVFNKMAKSMIWISLAVVGIIGLSAVSMAYAVASYTQMSGDGVSTSLNSLTSTVKSDLEALTLQSDLASLSTQAKTDLEALTLQADVTSTVSSLSTQAKQDMEGLTLRSETSSGFLRGSLREDFFFSLAPAVLMKPKYILSEKLETFTAGDGTASINSDNLYTAVSGTSLGNYGVVRTKKGIQFHPGDSAIGLFSLMIPELGVTGDYSLLWGGMFVSTDAITVGAFNGVFGVWYEHSGVLEVQTLTLSAATSSGGDVTITLDDVAYTVSVTADTSNVNAYEIATSLESQATGWDVYSIQNTVICLSLDAGTTADKTGVFNLALDTAVGTVGEFTETKTGIPKTSTSHHKAHFRMITYLGLIRLS